MKQWTARELNDLVKDHKAGMNFRSLSMKYNRNKNSVISAWNNWVRVQIYDWDLIKRVVRLP